MCIQFFHILNSKQMFLLWTVGGAYAPWNVQIPPKWGKVQIYFWSLDALVSILNSELLFFFICP